jgi:hypothetical protein
MMKLHNSILTIFLATFFSSTVASENYFGVNFTQIVQDGNYPFRNSMIQNDPLDFSSPRNNEPGFKISDPDVRMSMVNFVIGSTVYEGEIGSLSSNLSVELRLGVGMHNKSLRKDLDWDPDYNTYGTPTGEEEDILVVQNGENKRVLVSENNVADQEIRNLKLDLKAFYGIYYKYSIGISELIFPYVVLGYSKAEEEHNYTVVLNSQEILNEKAHVSEHDVSYGFGVRFGQTESSSLNIEYMNYLGSKNMPYDGISLALRVGF